MSRVTEPPRVGTGVWTALPFNKPDPVWGGCYFDSPAERNNIRNGLVFTTHDEALKKGRELEASKRK